MQLEEALDLFLNESLERILLSGSRKPDAKEKCRLRPVLMGEKLMFQSEEQVGKQAFHRNMSRAEAAAYVKEQLETTFRQAQIESKLGYGQVLVSKKGKMTVKVKQAPSPTAPKIRPAGASAPQGAPEAPCSSTKRILAHNRKKQYILEEGRPVPFLIDLGVMTGEGKIVNSRYDKFRQINRFLEFIEDILPELDGNRENTIIDFGCGKSYLTFAMYYYLKVLKNCPVRIIGLDLKRDVIDHCNALSLRYGYDRLDFFHGDIASYEGVSQVDMVVTLHACDTATDYALEKAVKWGAKVILSVPCCQHQLNRQIKNELMDPVFCYGLIRERMAALYTDAIRAQVLEYCGYRTQILEFIDMEHTPKNILIRAVLRRTGKKNGEELCRLLDFLQAEPELVKLLAPELCSFPTGCRQAD